MKLFLLSISVFMAFFGQEIVAKEIDSKGDQMIVVVMGPPGSGKGTQAALLIKELGVPHISTGDLFRENISQNTALGKKAKSYIDKGQLVPDEVVLDMLFDRVSQKDCDKGYLLDGFPRTLAQAEALDTHLGKASLIVLNLEVPDNVIIKRAEGRLICSGCPAVYNKTTSLATTEEACTQCGGKLIRRPDDEPEIVKNRLNIYHSQTKPLIAFYEKKGVLFSVDGTQGADTVFAILIKQIKAQKKS